MNYLALMTARFSAWLPPEQAAHYLTRLMICAAILLVTYLSIKLLSYLLERTLKGNGKETGGQEELPRHKYVMPDNVVNALRDLLKNLLVYGGYFVALLIILDVFAVTVISPEDLKVFGIKVFKIIAVLIGARVVISFGQMVIRRFFERHELKVSLEKRRAQTLEVLLHSVLSYGVFFLAGITMLQILGINTAAILASAGILSLAVGFGAQNLIKDVISGFFVLLEDQFSVGDFIETAGVVGTVEEIGLRTCKIRQWTGQLHIIPNGQITQVTNYNRGQNLAVVTVRVAYEEDIDQVINILREECAQARQEIGAIVDLPQVQGVTDLADASVNIRIFAPTISGEQWAVERELRRRLKNALERAGIEMPYPKQVVYTQPYNHHHS